MAFQGRDEAVDFEPVGDTVGVVQTEGVTASMVGNASLNAKILTSLPASAGIVLLARATDAVITAAVALTSISTILLMQSTSTG